MNSRIQATSNKYMLHLIILPKNGSFFIELDIKGEKSGEKILPVFWDDNYVSGLPGGKKEIAGYFYTKALKNDYTFI